MVNFLIHRPVAVTMTFLALLLIGLATTTRLPVSLMPAIDIPVVSIRVSLADLPARQLENTVVKPLRNVLKEVNNVETMKSEARDGTAWVELRFRHRTSIDLASVEVNEKVDKAMNYLPRDMRRPEVIRASASDIPVFYLMVTQKGTEASPSQFASTQPSANHRHWGIEGGHPALQRDRGGLRFSQQLRLPGYPQAAGAASGSGAG